jgi:hypothetical protein
MYTSILVHQGDTCARLASRHRLIRLDYTTLYGETLDNLLLWNPSLVTGNTTGGCTLLPGYRYCAQLDAAGKHGYKSHQLFNDANTVDLLAPLLPASNLCLPLEPADRKIGTADNCYCFSAVFGYENGCK